MDRVVPYELPLRADAKSVAEARRYFSAIAAGEGLPVQVRDAGALVVSELVTNAVTHGRNPITLRVTAMERTVRVAVTDGSDRPPTPRPRSSGDPLESGAASGNHGRGLAIVASVSEQWGCSPAVQEPGKTVWCNLTIGRDGGA